MNEEQFDALAQQALADIADHYQLPELAYEDGGCALNFNRGRSILLYPEFEVQSLLMRALIGVVPFSGSKTGELFLDMLQGNDGWSRTQGATLGIDPENGIASLWCRLPLPADGSTLIETVQGLLGAAEYWLDVIKGFGGQPLFESVPETGEATGAMLKA